ncbi:GNAT family N-acetyltransferase [Streptomyces sp. NPDC020845]|uniref:GNAT family N-acetyltransferase n=1 Tax=Streptomyces sp. NPDC020845 TaxID=3365096 RepID=UPI00379ED34C
MDIRQCRKEDLDRLERHMPSPGRTQRHAMRFERQQQGLSTFLVAWSNGSPVGTAQILWQGCEAPEVRDRFPECPELNGLGVWPPQLRSQGIGTAIIRAAENQALPLPKISSAQVTLHAGIRGGCRRGDRAGVC